MNREQVAPHYSIHRAHGNMSAAGVRRSDTDHDGDGGNDSDDTVTRTTDSQQMSAS